MAQLPNVMQTRVTQADDAEEVVKEVEGRPPAEVQMLHWVIVSLENPVGWHFGDEISLGLIVEWGVGSWRRDRVH